MIYVFEIAGMLVLLGVVMIFFKAAKARPDDPSLRTVAFIALAAWAGFAVLTLVDFGYVSRNITAILQTMAGLIVLAGLVLGYRAVLREARKRSGPDDAP